MCLLRIFFVFFMFVKIQIQSWRKLTILIQNTNTILMSVRNTHTKYNAQRRIENTKWKYNFVFCKYFEIFSQTLLYTLYLFLASSSWINKDHIVLNGQRSYRAAMRDYLNYELFFICRRLKWELPAIWGEKSSETVDDKAGC